MVRSKLDFKPKTRCISDTQWWPRVQFIMRARRLKTNEVFTSLSPWPLCHCSKCHACETSRETIIWRFILFPSREMAVDKLLAYIITNHNYLCIWSQHLFGPLSKLRGIARYVVPTLCFFADSVISSSTWSAFLGRILGRKCSQLKCWIQGYSWSKITSLPFFCCPVATPFSTAPLKLRSIYHRVYALLQLRWCRVVGSPTLPFMCLLQSIQLGSECQVQTM